MEIPRKAQLDRDFTTAFLAVAMNRGNFQINIVVHSFQRHHKQLTSPATTVFSIS